MDYKDDNYPHKIYSDDISERIKERLDELVTEFNRDNCVCCGAPLDFDHVDMYDHESGWEVDPEVKKQWLSVHCKNCNYDISFTKLGVRRP